MFNNKLFNLVEETATFIRMFHNYHIHENFFEK